MIDLDNTASTMAIISSSGVFYDNGSSIEYIYSTGVTPSHTRNGVPMVLFSDVAGNVGVVYSDDNINLIIKQPTLDILCGDGICQALENAFTCPADCGDPAGTPTDRNDTGDLCFTNENCYSGNCQYGMCEPAPFKAECVQDAQCASLDCNNNRCTREGLATQIKNLFKSLFGSDDLTLLLISLVLIVVLCIGVYLDTKSLVLTVIVGFIGFILCVAMSFISLWVLLIMILITLIIGALIVFTKSQQL